MWSPALDTVHQIAQYWKNRKKFFGNVYETGLIMVSAHKFDIEDSPTLSLDEVETLIKKHIHG